MYAKTLIFGFILFAGTAFAQQQQETLLKKENLRGGFGGPIFSWSNTNGQTGYGAGGGGGVVFDRLFVGVFGMGETFDNPKIGTTNLAMGYGGLWLGYTFPSHKLLHLYTSLKIAGGSVGTTDFEEDWDFQDQWNDVTFVAVPEAGL